MLNTLKHLLPTQAEEFILECLGRIKDGPLPPVPTDGPYWMPPPTRLYRCPRKERMPLGSLLPFTREETEEEELEEEMEEEELEEELEKEMEEGFDWSLKEDQETEHEIELAGMYFDDMNLDWADRYATHGDTVDEERNPSMELDVDDEESASGTQSEDQSQPLNATPPSGEQDQAASKLLIEAVERLQGFTALKTNMRPEVKEMLNNDTSEQIASKISSLLDATQVSTFCISSSVRFWRNETRA